MEMEPEMKPEKETEAETEETGARWLDVCLFSKHCLGRGKSLLTRSQNVANVLLLYFFL